MMRRMSALGLVVWRGVTAFLGPEEAVLLVALVLVTVGLWPLAARWAGSGWTALLVPGLVLLWLALPSRAPFVIRDSAPTKPTGRNT